MADPFPNDWDVAMKVTSTKPKEGYKWARMDERRQEQEPTQTNTYRCRYPKGPKRGKRRPLYRRWSAEDPKVITGWVHKPQPTLHFNKLSFGIHPSNIPLHSTFSPAINLHIISQSKAKVTKEPIFVVCAELSQLVESS
ncbi:hypothetical protein Ddc_06817 [Ditylenchus destructor]|nr:hypothetical protein Ddc_06817 [Ditylenchus destructor]